ncbi:MAG TPA: DegV family protein [Firmicutes bacterium]|nr:DegV family protein [Bacillota bacterium]
MPVRLVTDSTADLPESLVRKYGITVVPLYVHFGEEALRDGVDIWASEFYYRLENSGLLPHTSQPSPGDFLEVYHPLVEEGAEVLSIHLSRALSGTCQSAEMAAGMIGRPVVTVVDSGLASLGVGMVVLEAARRIEAGAGREEAAAAARRASERLRVYFVVETLEYLQKNGRIGRASGFLGSLLNVRPLLTLQDGVVTPVEKVRGKGKAVNRIFELLHERLGDKPARFAVVHGDRPDEALSLADRVKREFNCVEPPIAGYVGPVIGCHVGPGLVGVVALPDE